MQLASTFDQFNTSMQEPAETAIKGYFPVGNITGMGSVSISAMELVIPSKELMFQGIRFEVTPADQYALTGIATIPLGEVEKLLLALGRVDKRDSQGGLIVIQAGICDGDQLGTRPDVGRRMGIP